jgi:hypothetical protein
MESSDVAATGSRTIGEQGKVGALSAPRVAGVLSQLITLVTGSVVVAQATKNPDVAMTNKKLAEGILKAAKRG